ncbi:MAG: UDP-glucose 4-epimerase GalE [Chloroflexi bacterium]|nr:MAG: UDP-glucose 4-epimerase GalE [Chloroflexota bacterium]
MRILVTGGAGYIGSFTARALHEAGHHVVVYDNLSFGHPQPVEDMELVIADLADRETLDTCIANGHFDAVVHFAAFIEAGESMKDGARFFANNTGNSIQLLNAAAHHGIQQLVFSSTAGVYGDLVRIPIRESDPTAPINVYAESKLLVERMLPWYDSIHGLRSVSLRYFNAAGGALDGSMGQDHEPATHLLTVAIKAAIGVIAHLPLNGDDYPTPDGTCIRDYIHVLDLASAHILALAYLAGGGTTDVFNVGAGVGYSNRDVIKTLKDVGGVDFAVEVGPRRPGDPAELVADATKLRRATGWVPENSDLGTIVASAWRWHSAHPDGYASHDAARAHAR